MHFSIPLPVTNPQYIFDIFFTIPAGHHLPKSILALAIHNAINKIPFFQPFIYIKGNFRTTEPDFYPGHNLLQPPGHLPHNSNIPYITGKADHICLFPVQALKNFFWILIDGIFHQLHLRLITAAIRLQTVDRQIRMNIFCIDCC